MSRPLSKAPEEQAADWVARLEGGILSSTDAQALQTWIDSDPGNKALLTEFQRLHRQVKLRVPVLAQTGTKFDFTPDAIRRPSRQWAWGLAAAAAFVLAGFWWHSLPKSLVTHVAERQTVTLSDGTRADINARTSISVTMLGSERRLRLAEGEIYLEVAKDPSRPFLVETPEGTIRVTGTHFNVRADSPSDLEVTVLEGSVSVKTAGSDHDLKPQDQLSCAGTKATLQKLTPSTADDAIAWREGEAIFAGIPLRSAVGQFARYHGCEIQVAPSIASLSTGGRFKLDDLDGFLLDIERGLPVKVQRLSDNRFRIDPR
jgi:transmembrane sensor